MFQFQNHRSYPTYNKEIILLINCTPEKKIFLRLLIIIHHFSQKNLNENEKLNEDDKGNY